MCVCFVCRAVVEYKDAAGPPILTIDEAKAQNSLLDQNAPNAKGKVVRFFIYFYSVLFLELCTPSFFSRRKIELTKNKKKGV